MNKYGQKQNKTTNVMKFFRTRYNQMDMYYHKYVMNGLPQKKSNAIFFFSMDIQNTSEIGIGFHRKLW